MPEQPSNGSVEEEVSLLAEALAGLGRSASVQPGTEPVEADVRGARNSGRQEPGLQYGHACAECGCAVPAICVACPLCRVASLIHGFRPDTLVRLADLAGALSDVLQAAADRPVSDVRGNHTPARASVEEIPVIRHRDPLRGNNVRT